MEERAIEITEKKPASAQEGAFKAIVVSYLDKLPIEIRKKIEDYLLFEKIPWEIKELIARALVDSATDIDEARQAGKDLRNLSQANREFRTIINSETFTKYAINTLADKVGMTFVSAATTLGTLGAAQLLKKQSNVDDWLKFEINEELSVAHGALSVVKFLVEAGADFHTIPVLLHAARDGFLDIVKFILTKDLSPEEKGYALIDLLSSSLPNKEEKIKKTVQVLIDAGAAVNLRDSYTGWSTLKVAKRRNLNEIAKMLEEAGAKEE